MSNLTRDPFDAFTPIREAINRFMDEGVISPDRLLAIGRTFPVDVLDMPEAYVIECGISGVKPADIHITTEENTITIRTGGRAQHAAGKDAVYLRRERIEWPTPEVSRTLTLPTRIDPEKVSASYEHGVLKIKVAKAEGSKARTIPVAVKEPARIS